jgi:hypothetical protein
MIAITIVAINIIFSTPRFVWCPDEKPSPPPNAPPRPASDCCKRMPPIRSNDKTIWIYGMLETMLMMNTSILFFKYYANSKLVDSQ